MKRLCAAVFTLLLSPALAAAGPAQSLMEKAKPAGPPDDTAYVFLDSMDGNSGMAAQAYLELPRAKPVDGRVTLWTATVPPSETVVDGAKGWLMLVRMGFDCQTRQHRWSGGVVLDATGEVIQTDAPGDWIDTEPESMIATALKVACGEQDPPAEVLVGVAGLRADAAKRYRRRG